jgi:hypothetical protein
MSNNRKILYLKILCLLIILIINFISFWYLLSFLGIKGINPIGFRDSFGLVFPPYWFIFITFMISLAEYAVLATFFPLKKT